MNKQSNIFCYIKNTKLRWEEHFVSMYVFIYASIVFKARIHLFLYTRFSIELSEYGYILRFMFSLIQTSAYTKEWHIPRANNGMTDVTTFVSAKMRLKVSTPVMIGT